MNSPNPTFTLQTISTEQQQARDLISTSHVMVDAVAGSGKTTLALYIAKKYAKDHILLLTYNKHLKFETREKREHLGLANLTVHSYHSCYNAIFSKCPDDSALIDIIRSNSEPWPRPLFSLIIIDEAQDITPLNFEAICNLLRWNTMKTPRLCKEVVLMIYEIFEEKIENIYLIAPYFCSLLRNASLPPSNNSNTCSRIP